jgi:signal transduction histidine kinase
MEPRHPTQDELQRLEDLAAIVMDELELRRTSTILERERSKLERENDDLEAFSYSVAHDLKNPLTSLEMASDTLATELEESGETAQEIAGMICSETTRMQAMIDELLTLAQIRRADVVAQPADMEAIVTSVIEDLGAALSEATLDLPENWPPVAGNEEWLKRVWTNLLSNAAKYGGTPLHIAIETHREADGDVSYWVQDNGPGISPERQDHIFEAFTRLGHEETAGHGVGLSIVKRIVEKLGGKVWVRSRPDLRTGTQVGFTLSPPAQASVTEDASNLTRGH